MLIAVLVGQGGHLPYIIPAVGFIAAIFIILVAAYPPHAGWPSPLWLCALFAAPIIIACLQALPCGWHHPWLHDDIAALANFSAPTAWSINPGVSLAYAAWLLMLGATLWLLMILFPQERKKSLAQGTVLILATYALYALCSDVMRVQNGARTLVIGDFAYHNHAGAAWATCLPLAIYLAFTTSRWFWAVTAILLIAVVHSASRGAILLSMLLVIPWFLWLAPRPQRLKIIALACVAGGILFTIVGIGAAGSRFRELGDGQAETLNGRSIIWETASPVIAQATAFGSGAGTTPIAMQRAAHIDSTGPIEHLHSDPLELLLDYGWLGCCLIVAGLILAVALLVHSAKKVEPTRDKRFHIALGLALMMLGIHCCTDYILHNPVINVLIVIWLACLTQTWLVYRPTPTGMKRACALAMSVVLMGASGFLLVRERELYAVPTLEKATAQAATAWTPTYAADMAALVLDNPQQAKKWLDHAQQLSLSSLTAWRVRVLLALSQHDITGALNYSMRLMTWAPDAHLSQDIVMQLFKQHQQAVIGDKRSLHLARILIQDDRERDMSDWEILSHITGNEELITRLQAHPVLRVRYSAEAWMRKYAGLEHWLAFKATLPIRFPLDPIQLPIVRSTHDQRTFSVFIAPTKEQRRTQAERCLRAFFMLPDELYNALKDDGEVGVIYRTLSNNMLDEKLPNQLDTLLHVPWAKAWWEITQDVQAVQQHEWTRLNQYSHPPFLEQAWKATAATDNLHLQKRFEGWLHAYDNLQWIDAGWHVTWSWIRVVSNNTVVMIPDGWTGVFIDGKWHGWQRGSLPLHEITSPGIHHLTFAPLP